MKELSNKIKHVLTMIQNCFGLDMFDLDMLYCTIITINYIVRGKHIRIFYQRNHIKN